MNKLTSSILHSLSIEQDGKNWVFSPASYLEAIGNLSVCVKGDNLNQILRVAPHVGGEQAKGLETYNCLLHSAEYGPHLEPAIVDILAARGADLKSFNGMEVIDLVNNIVAQKTNGKITHLLSAKDIGPFLKFIILNCVYFKKDWVYEFDAPYMSQDFNGAHGISSVKYLKKQHRYHFYEDDKLDIAELPYKDSNVCCYIMVPKVSLFEIFNNISDNLAKIGKVKSGIEVNLWVPPFITESTFDLKDATQSAGLTKMWQANQDWTLVDLPKLAEGSTMWVEFIKQKAYIDFTRKGTEAAAATAIGMCLCSGGFFGTPPPVKYIHADKPFLYVLADKNAPDKSLFVGVINDI